MRLHNAGVSGFAVLAFIGSFLTVLGALGAVSTSQQQALMATAEVGNVSSPPPGTANSQAADKECEPVNTQCGCGEIMQNGKCKFISEQQNMHLCGCAAQTPQGVVQGKCVSQDKCQATSLPKSSQTPTSNQIASNDQIQSDAPPPGVTPDQPPSVSPSTPQSGASEGSSGQSTGSSGAGNSGGGSSSSGAGYAGSSSTGGASSGSSDSTSGGTGSGGSSGTGGSSGGASSPGSSTGGSESPASNSFPAQPSNTGSSPSSAQSYPASPSLNSGVGANSSFGSGASTGSLFSGLSGLGGSVSGLEPILAQNQQTSGQIYSSEYNSGASSYAPVLPTFMGSTGFQQSAPVVSTDNSSLTNLVSSIGNVSLDQFFEYLGTLFGTLSSQPTVQNGSQSGNDLNPELSNPQQNTSGTVISNVYETPQILGNPPQISQDELTNPVTEGQQSAQTGQGQYESLAQLLTSGAPSITPSDILAILQSTNAAPATYTGIPSIDLTPTSSFEQQQSISSGPNTAGSSQTVPEQFYIEESDLAQEQSNYQWLLAQIQAWQNAQAAGVCDSTCSNALSLLQSEQPDQLRQVQDLQTLVNQGPTVFESSSSVPAQAVIPNVTTQAPGAGLSSVVSDETSALQTSVPAEGAPYYVEQNGEWCDQYGQCIPESAFDTSPAQYVAPQMNTTMATASTMLAQNSSASVDPVTAIVRTLQSLVSDIVSLFTPTSENGGQSSNCSLFSSLFGGCEGY